MPLNCRNALVFSLLALSSCARQMPQHAAPQSFTRCIQTTPPECVASSDGLNWEPVKSVAVTR